MKNGTFGTYTRSEKIEENRNFTIVQL